MAESEGRFSSFHSPPTRRRAQAVPWRPLLSYVLRHLVEAVVVVAMVGVVVALIYRVFFAPTTAEIASQRAHEARTWALEWARLQLGAGPHGAHCRRQHGLDGAYLCNVPRGKRLYVLSCSDGRGAGCTLDRVVSLQ